MTMTTGNTQPKAPIQGAGQIKAGVSATSVKSRYLTEEEILLDASIEAKSFEMGDSLQIKEIKNFDYVYRWVNRSGQGGQLLRQRRMSGFTNATKEDVELADEQSAILTDGSIVVGDLVLMKLPVQRYYAGIKASLLKAQNAVRTESDKTTSQFVPANAPADVQKLVSPIKPSTEALDEKIAAARVAEMQAIAAAAGTVTK